MPQNLPAVLGIIAYLEARNIAPVTLLVVPGSGWVGEDLQTLRTLQQRGYILAGHGWTHRVSSINGFKHWLHSRCISRNAAEHLALNGNQIADLIGRCYYWFPEHGLQPPELYVPPAWAMGAISREQLRNLPFRQFEYFGGIYDRHTDKFYYLPVVGYEADTPWRVPPLRLWNAFNSALARYAGTLRVAIHPYDLALKLGGDLHALLEASIQCCDYQNIVDLEIA